MSVLDWLRLLGCAVPEQAWQHGGMGQAWGREHGLSTGGAWVEHGHGDLGHGLWEHEPSMGAHQHGRHRNIINYIEHKALVTHGSRVKHGSMGAWVQHGSMGRRSMRAQAIQLKITTPGG